MNKEILNPTLSDVADAAGVSAATVSRVLNGKPYVSAYNHKLVAEAIQKLNYRPNAAARHLATGKSNTIGVFVIGSQLSGPAAILSAVESEARKMGLSVVVSVYDDYIEDDPLHKAEIDAIFNNFFKADVDAIICVQSYSASAHILYYISAEVPIFFAVSDDAESQKDDRKFFVTIDQRYGVRKAMDHLEKYKHDKVAYFAGPQGSLDADIRLNEVEKMAKKYKMHLEVIPLDTWLSKHAYIACHQYFTRHKRHYFPTAIFTGNDLQAIGVLRALHDLGIGVPNDISVVGFDDYPGTNYLIPSLTTIKQPYNALGKKIMKHVSAYIGGEEIEHRTFVKPRLIERESTNYANMKGRK